MMCKMRQCTTMEDSSSCQCGAVFYFTLHHPAVATYLHQPCPPCYPERHNTNAALLSITPVQHLLLTRFSSVPPMRNH